ncbi:FKBP-type peptidyl-prolyl cis-trans isomerase N-terminal domain-containing protein [Gibbsiella quercinecans]|uniref:FKBP-type peptidyl-prolyl cis-trans isomerase N-terminal domain-containing protein n=1 Tax=Gibbsiella quercinecans TaxID=929813 RepID=UPI000EF15230|nr:FKBP-type peptidyl-prolyl cis-trans isomerase N-terminal domain-containing protein [Gibbsiella quercinecans]RLM06324.1 FKBP-type peptidylprolyl isomerase [Gibbsiella quercinecans]
MKRPVRLTLSLLATLLALPCGADAQSGVPALLQFAEQYQQQSEAAPAAKPAPADPRRADKKSADGASEPVKKAPQAPAATVLPLRQALRERDEQLARQTAELNALRQEVHSLRLAAPAAPPSHAPDLALLQQWLAGMRQAVQGTPDEQRKAALIQQAQQRAAQARVAEEKVRAQADTLATQLAQAQQTSQAQQVQAQQQQTELAVARQEIGALRQHKVWQITPEQLTDDRARMSYAVGSALGKDIQGLVQERQGWGVRVDQDILLTGVLDTVAGHPALPQPELAALMAKADAAANAARDAVVNARETKDKAYVADFRGQKGVKQSDMGFWYRVDYAGDAPLAEGAIIEVVVKEMLTDGAVVQDMELSGKVLAQPLSAYPPLFREAIGHLRNHGSLTMVVPPALAYGESGYPPKVPPNATMVYQLRIDNSHAP